MKTIQKTILLAVILITNTVFSQEKIYEQTISLDQFKYIFTEKSTDESIKEIKEKLKNKANIDLNIKNIKRNKDGKITAMDISYDDNNGTTGSKKIKGDEPIKPISFSYKKDKNGNVNTNLSNEDKIIRKYEVVDFKYTEDDTNEDDFIKTLKSKLKKDTTINPTIIKKFEVSDVKYIDDSITDDKFLKIIKPKSSTKIITIKTDKDGKLEKAIVENGKEIEKDVLKISEEISDNFTFDLDFNKLLNNQTLRFSLENLNQLKSSETMKNLENEMKILKEEMEKMKEELEKNKKEEKNSKIK